MTIPLENQLLALKKDVEQAQIEFNQLEGQKKELTKQLNIEWKCETVIEAQKKVKAWESEHTSLTEKAEEGISSFKKQYNFSGDK
jgi:non-homologous end joining protein Ku